MRKSAFLFIALIFISVCSLQAQNLSVTAQIDSSVIAIGGQTALTFEINQLPGNKVICPLFSDTLLRGIEIVEPLRSDTSVADNGNVLIKQRYVITSFEDSLYYIPPYPFVFNGDTVWTKSLSLKVVQPFQIDTATAQIADIKNVMEPKRNWKAIARIALIILLLIIASILTHYFYKKYFKKKSTDNISPELLLPASVVAISKLDKIKNEKAWQQNRTKEFHTEITDTLRVYIERIYDLPCMEMTSEEIIEHLNHLKFENKKAYSALIQILKLADLVKFAKWEATPDEHELSLANVYLFVNETKINEEQEETTAPQNLKEVAV